MTMNNERPHAAQKPAPAGGSFQPEPPSDLELMMYFDGELEEPRRGEVAAFVGVDLAARSKVSGLRMASALVQERAQSLSAADDIADLVMAKIAAGASTGAHAPAPVIHDVGQSLPQDVRQSLPQLQPVLVPATARPAANDNGRRILVGLSALVAAAAAVLAVWSRQPASGPSSPTPTSPVAALSTPRSPTTARTAPPVPPSSDAEIDAAGVSPEAESEHGVEVAAVNFGSHMGSIFYVPSGSIEANRTTTVVWLADDAGE